MSKESIEANLLAAGWTKEQIDPVLFPKETIQPMNKPNVLADFRLSSWLLRIGLAFVFVYAALALSLNPSEGTHFMPSFVAAIIPAKVFLPVFAICEIALSIWLLSGKRHR
ncbi:MAG: hypothetical protein ACRDFB_00050, partial [Rhabdochlamydiaceae bacterium]